MTELTEGLARGDRFQVLLGATGTGKTFTMAHVIANHGRPTLVMSHNKTLAAQLYGEMKALFPSNAVEYFVSYYDYYQPEAYLPATDTYIEKDASINEDIERLRLRATSALMERDDVMIVASVSSIYGLGNPRDYRELMLHLSAGEEKGRREILKGLVAIQYKRNDYSFERGTFRVRGDTVEIFPAYEEQGIRVELWGDEVERITRFDPLTGEIISNLDRTAIYPASHYVTRRSTIEQMVPAIREELKSPDGRFKEDGQLLEAQRIEQRTNFDIEMMLELGTCPGSRTTPSTPSGRRSGERPACLLDYFPEEFLVIVDESHVSLPQITGMYRGDRSRKGVLVEHGFRLPSAMDNRPLKFEEWESVLRQVVFVSATPGEWELEQAGGVVVEQIIRPTGLVDPQVDVRPVKGQVDDLLAEIREREKRKERVLVTTLTKRMAEDLSEYLASVGVRVRYMHSEIDTIERMDILRAAAAGPNRRPGGDQPVAGGPRSSGGIPGGDPGCGQGRVSAGCPLAYPDHWKGGPECAGESHHVCRQGHRFHAQMPGRNQPEAGDPASAQRGAGDHSPDDREVRGEIEFSTRVADVRDRPVAKVAEKPASYADEVNREEFIKILEEEMRQAAEALDFEKAALLRDQLFEVKAEGDDRSKKGKGRRRPLGEELRAAAEAGD